MEKYLLTDLACELYKNDPDGRVKKLKKVTISSDLSMEKMYISDGASGESEKRFITFFSPKLWQLSNESYLLLSEMISKELRSIVKGYSHIRKEFSELSFLVAGIGNPTLNPDALGAETVSNIAVTGHLPKDNLLKIKKCRISAFSPDVTGNTGIETVELIRSCVQCMCPDILIVVDSLAAKSCDRLAATVQISNYGIFPGSGVGLKRRAIDFDNLGIPVISMGVPTVVNSSTLVAEVLKRVEVSVITDELLGMLEDGKGFFVTPTDIELVIKSASLVLSNAINMLTSIDGHE